MIHKQITTSDKKLPIFFLSPLVSFHFCRSGTNASPNYFESQNDFLYQFKPPLPLGLIRKQLMR